MSDSPLLARLNDEQRAAVTLAPEHALILAGAGSGKTSVLTTRIAWLISTGQVSPYGVLAVTFTNKAAREMQTRLAAMLPIDPRGMWIGTFHGLCNRMLRAHHRDAGLPQTFQILDSQDQLAAIKRLLKTMEVDDEKFPARSVQHFINQSKEQGLRAGDVEAHDAFTRRCVEIFQAYDDQCQREGVVDFAELLLRSYELLSRHQLLREHYQRRFSHILIDEFQDTNALQYRWIGLLAGGRDGNAALFAVGDDDQSIYAFRGANAGNMAAFERDYGVRHLIKLEQNYRSHGHILDCANALISHNDRRLGKNLWTDAGDGEQVRVHEAMTDGEEARWLVEEIQTLAAEGDARRQMAVLYRSNAQSRVIEHSLFSAGLPYRVYGGLRFFERAEIKHAMAYLRLLDNPDDDGAFLRVANFPARGIGARTLENLQDAARRNGTGLFRAAGELAGAAGAKVAAFTALVQRMGRDSTDLALPALVEHVVESSGLVPHYESEREGQERIENLRELVNAAAAFLAEEGIGQDVPARLGVARQDAPAAMDPVSGSATVANDARDAASAGAGDDATVDPNVDVLSPDAPDVARITPLAAFLSHASLEAGENQAGEGSDAVQLMTVHSAKGLEFDTVFITGLEEGLFPHENAATEPEGLEEERRLMYVAITRARRRLYLSHAQTRMLHGQTRYHLRSRFLEELPDAALKWLTPRARAGSGSGAGFGAARDGWGAGWEGFAGRNARFGSARSGPGYGGARGGGYAASSSAGHAPDASDRRAAAAFDRGLPWRIGQSVSHGRFGEGVILDIEGRGDDARVQVRFGSGEAKWLALSVAKLQAV